MKITYNNLLILNILINFFSSILVLLRFYNPNPINLLYNPLTVFLLNSPIKNF